VKLLKNAERQMIFIVMIWISFMVFPINYVYSQWCQSNEDCDDGLYCNGPEVCQYIRGWWCRSVFPYPCPNDGLYCNGVEGCNEFDDVCTHSGNPCQLPTMCHEITDRCGVTPECDVDEDCDDGLYCNGAEKCVNRICQPGTNPCPNNWLFCNGFEQCLEFNDKCSDPYNPCEDADDCTDDICHEYTSCENVCNATGSRLNTCCQISTKCQTAEICQEGMVKIGNQWANCGSVGVKIPICLENPEVPISGFQIDLCEHTDDCLVCVDCELTERTQLFDCAVNELDNGCCRVILFSKHPGGVINPGECDIVTIVYEIKDEPVCCYVCIEIYGGNIVVVDQYGYEVRSAGLPGTICPFVCGDIEPADDTATPGWDCGDSDVDLFDILMEVDFALAIKDPDECQGPAPTYGPRDDVPTGTPPYCVAPDEQINILDVMTLIDMALQRQDCCSYYYGGKIY